MSGKVDDAAAMVAGALSRRAPKERAGFLRELLAHTAAGQDAHTVSARIEAALRSQG